MTRKLRVEPIRSSWGNEAHLGPYVRWAERRHFEIGLCLATLIVGLRFRWGKELFDPTETTRYPEVDLGTNLARVDGNYRYGRAGEDLQKWTIVEADLAGRIAPPPAPSTVKITAELIWGNVKAAKEIDPGGINVLGWPEVNVKKGWYCWLHQPQPGAEFKREES